MRRISIEYARQQGLAFVLCNQKGDIKAAGKDQRMLYLAQRRKEKDMIIKTEQYRDMFPNSK